MVLKPNPNFTEVVLFQDGDRLIFNLLTRNRYFEILRYPDLAASLESCLKKCIIINVSHLAMPDIGCGLDQLDKKVQKIIENLFLNTNIMIIGYMFALNMSMKNANLFSGSHCCEDESQCHFQLYSQFHLLMSCKEVQWWKRIQWALYQRSSRVLLCNRDLSPILNVSIVRDRSGCGIVNKIIYFKTYFSGIFRES